MFGQTGKKRGNNEAAELTSDLMPRLDRLPWSRWHVKIVFALGFAWLLDALEANIIGSVLGILKNSWHFSSLQGSLTVSVWLVGIMVGAVVFGYLSDRFGRRPMFILTLLWYSLFTIACAFSQDIRVFIFLRFMAAIGIGGEYSAIASAVVEFIPKRARGKMDAFVMSLWPVGAMLSALFVVVALKFLPPETAWRAGFLLAVILAIFAVIIRRYLPESPRWLLDRQRIDEARAVVEAAEREVMRSTGLKELPAAEPIVMHVGMYTLSHHTKELFGRYPWRLALGSSLNFSQVALGYGSVAYASLVLFPATGTPPEAVPYYMMLAFFFAMCGGLTAMYMVDTVGRKITVVAAYASYPLSALSMIFVETTLSAVISLCIMQYCYTWGWITEYVIKSEIFPTRARAAGIGWATFFGRIGGVVAAPLLTWTYQSTRSITAVAYALAALMMPGLLAAMAWSLWGVEGKRRSLEELTKD